MRQSVNYEANSYGQYGWTEIGVAEISDEIFVDVNDLYSRFSTRYKIQVVTEIIQNEFCIEESEEEIWYSDLVSTTNLTINRSPSLNVNLTWDYSKFAFAKYIEIGTVGLIKAQEPKAKKIKRNCMTSLGHAVLD